MGVKESVGTWGWEGEEEWKDRDKDREGDQRDSSYVYQRADSQEKKEKKGHVSADHLFHQAL